MVDLAGSEGLDRSQVTGSRLDETKAINKSLSALTDVFHAIGNKQAHVPYRNSKLTHILQPALSGEGKTLMLANVSPTEESYFETLCSLKLASQVNKCELGKAKRQFGQNSTSTSGTTSGSSTPTCSTPQSSKTSSRKPITAISRK